MQSTSSSRLGHAAPSRNAPLGQRLRSLAAIGAIAIGAVVCLSTTAPQLAQAGKCGFDSDCHGNGKCKGGTCGNCGFNSDCSVGKCSQSHCGACGFDSDCKGGKCSAGRCSNAR